MTNKQNYDIMTKENLVQLCYEKDNTINKCIESIKINDQKMLGKNSIMEIYNCESNKALRILRLMFQMGYGNKIGKEYYVSKELQNKFVKDMVGKDVFI